MTADKDLKDIWDAIRSIRDDVDRLKKASEQVNGEFLMRSYNSIAERLDEMQKDVDNLKR